LLQAAERFKFLDEVFEPCPREFWGSTRGCQIGESIGERLEQPIEHRAAASHA
jgi:hypothetical protein